MKALNGFLMMQRQVTLKDICWYITLQNFIGHVCQTHMYDVLSEP